MHQNPEQLSLHVWLLNWFSVLSLLKGGVRCPRPAVICVWDNVTVFTASQWKPGYGTGIQTLFKLGFVTVTLPLLYFESVTTTAAISHHSILQFSIPVCSRRWSFSEPSQWSSKRGFSCTPERSPKLWKTASDSRGNANTGCGDRQGLAQQKWRKRKCALVFWTTWWWLEPGKRVLGVRSVRLGNPAGAELT